MPSFSDYIVKKRYGKELNQADLADALRTFDEKLFGSLCVETVSRWENGREPNSDKKKRVIEFFGDDINEYFPFSAKKEKLSHSCIYAYIKEKKLKDRRESPFFISSVIPGTPDECDIRSISECIHSDQYLKIIDRFNQDNPVKLNALVGGKTKAAHIPSADDHTSHIKPLAHDFFPHGSTNIFIAECFKSYFGHISFFKVDGETIERILQKGMLRSEISKANLDRKKQTSPILLHSIYFSNELSGAMLLCKLYEFVREHRVYISEIYCFSLDRSYNRLLRNMGFTECHHDIDGKPLYRCHVSEFLKPEDLAIICK